MLIGIRLCHGQADHGFADGTASYRDRFRESPYDTAFFFLQNAKGAARWPVTDEVEAELRKAMWRAVRACRSICPETSADRCGRGPCHPLMWLPRCAAGPQVPSDMARKRRLKTAEKSAGPHSDADGGKSKPLWKRKREEKEQAKLQQDAGGKKKKRKKQKRQQASAGGDDAGGGISGPATGGSGDS